MESSSCSDRLLENHQFENCISFAIVFEDDVLIPFKRWFAVCHGAIAHRLCLSCWLPLWQDLVSPSLELGHHAVIDLK